MAKVFTPFSNLYFSDLDGAWEFSEPVQRNRTVGEAEEIFSFDEPVILNSSEHPQYLVQNRFAQSFPADGPVWLEITWQPWSTETERGFDDPYIVVYLNDQIVFKEGIDGHCCQLRNKQLYLGELTGENTLSIFSGEIGDLQKPTGIEIQSLTLLTENKTAVTEEKVSEKKTETSPTPLPQSGEVLGVKNNTAETHTSAPLPSPPANSTQEIPQHGIFWISIFIVLLLTAGSILLVRARRRTSLAARKENKA